MAARSSFHRRVCVFSSLRLDRTLNFDVTWVPNGNKDHVVKLAGGMERLLSSCSSVIARVLGTALPGLNDARLSSCLGEVFVASGRQAAWRLGEIVVGPCRQAAWRHGAGAVEQ